MTLIPKTQLDQLWGAARVHTDGTSASTTGFREGAISATLRTGQGVYVITLGTGQGVDFLQCVPNVTLMSGATNDDFTIVQDSDTQFTVRTFAATVATDRAFYFELRKVRSEA